MEDKPNNQILELFYDLLRENSNELNTMLNELEKLRIQTAHIMGRIDTLLKKRQSIVLEMKIK